jgi:hypothetical protein
MNCTLNKRVPFDFMGDARHNVPKGVWLGLVGPQAETWSSFEILVFPIRSFLEKKNKSLRVIETPITPCHVRSALKALRGVPLGQPPPMPCTKGPLASTDVSNRADMGNRQLQHIDKLLNA